MNNRFPAFFIAITTSTLAYSQAFAISLNTPKKAQVVAEQAFSASGEVALPHINLPARLHFSQHNKAFLIDVSINESDRSYIYYDWHNTPAKGYIQNAINCTSFSLGDSKSPNITSLFTNNKRNKKVNQGVSWQSTSNKDKKSTLRFQFKDTALIFKVEKIKPLNQPVINPIDKEACTEIKVAKKKNTSRLKRSVNDSGYSGLKTTVKSYSVSNLLYNFYGLYSSVTYAGTPFYQSSTEHQQAVDRCERDGEGVCKTEWELGGLFGRYGYYCGDGWDNRSYEPMSSLDYCCQMHDRHTWGENHLKNLCGFYACLSCSKKGSYQAFKDEHDAADIIEIFASTGAFLTGCSFDGWISGFSCSN